MYRQLMTMFQRSRSRSANMGRLAELDDHLLADIGLSRADLHRIRTGTERAGGRTHE
jgi:uncharacterized protein YjiS (DUF1127 family)